MIESDRERQSPSSIQDTEPSHLARYKFALNYLSQTDVVLDAPSGSGYGTSLLASKGVRVYGIDIYDKAIEHARKFFSLPSNSFHVGNIEDLLNLFPESCCFDLLVSFEGVEHLEHPTMFLNEARRLLKPNGRMIISTPRKPHGNPFHIKEYSLEEFTAELSVNFNIHTMFGQVYTDIFDLSERAVNPHDYRKFNFIAYCSPK